MYVLYHKGCVDGFTSAWVAWRALENATFAAVQYGDVAPVPNGEDVYILDFSYPRDELITLAERSRSVVVIDHHKTAAAALDGLENDRLDVRFDMEKSGAMLAWEYFFPGKTIPVLIRYVQDRDLWKWVEKHSREVSAAIASYNFDYTVWNWLAEVLETDYGIMKIKEEGFAILRYQQRIVLDLAVKAAPFMLDGHSVGVVNSSILQSEIGEAIGKKFGIGVVWYYSAGKYIYSLRSATNDVSVIAANHGGGGHKGAAGFTTSSPLWKDK